MSYFNVLCNTGTIRIFFIQPTKYIDYAAKRSVHVYVPQLMHS